MSTLQEEDLIFDVSSSVNAEKFDDNALHGTKSTMKKVDIIIEHEDKVVFLEVKDPDIPGAANPDQFKQDLQGGKLIPELAGKYRDSFLFTHFRGGYGKPINYVVLISMASLDDALILNRTDTLRSAIPISHRQWNQDSAASCMILKLDGYKKAFGDGSVWRASDIEN
ncbi:MAG: hypothetical protein AB2777_21975 [Candidatus Thiodiazotropha endolucinida]